MAYKALYIAFHIVCYADNNQQKLYALISVRRLGGSDALDVFNRGQAMFIYFLENNNINIYELY